MRAIVQTGMISIALVMLPLLLAMGCAGTPDAGLEGSAGSAVPSATTPPAPSCLAQHSERSGPYDAEY